jgi:cell division protein FtsN
MRHNNDTFVDDDNSRSTGVWKPVAMAAAVGLVFGAGYVFGEKARPAPARGVAAADATATADVRSERLNQVRAAVGTSAGLTYGRELASRETPLDVPDVAAGPVVAAKAPRPELRSEPKAELALTSAVKPSPVSPPVSVASALQKIALPAPAKAAAQATSYVVQLASLPSDDAAQKMRAALQDKGQRAQVVSALVEGKKVFRVMTSPLSSREAAEALQKKLGQGLVMRAP